MSTATRLKALAAKFDAKHHAKILALCAEDKTDDQIASCIEADDQAALQARCDAAEAKVAELQAQVTDLQAQLAAKNPAADATATATRGVKPVPHTAAGQKAEASAVDAPKTISDGIRVVLGENPTMKPLAARAEARKRWPDLKHV